MLEITSITFHTTTTVEEFTDFGVTIVCGTLTVATILIHGTTVWFSK